MPKNRSGQYYSDHINRRVTQSIFRAFDFAATQQTPLNTYVVINLRDRTEAAAVTAFEAIRHKFRDWLNNRAKRDGKTPRPPAYVYAIECPEGLTHANWAIHVPDAHKAEFAAKLQKWVKRAQGALGPFDVHCEPVTASHAKVLAKYIVKGTDPAFVAHFYLDDYHAPQGRIWGKRAGVSPSLGKAARDAAGFRPQRRRAKTAGWYAGRQARPVGTAHLTALPLCLE